MKKCKILSFGEIIWDIFNNDYKIGGAPFNFSADAVMLGADADLVSAVGNDDLGTQALKMAEKYKIGKKYITVNNYPTGRCNVSLTDGVPAYNIEHNTAYDYITFNDNYCDYDFLYFGSLALRNDVSFCTLKSIISNIDCVKVCDINIRQNYYDYDLLDYLFSVTDILKLSREDLACVSDCINCSKDYKLFSNYIFDNYNSVSVIIITLDKDGAVLFTRDNKMITSVRPVNEVVSTVGAGDGFTASFVVNYFNTDNLEFSLNEAVKFSDNIVTLKGALPEI